MSAKKFEDPVHEEQNHFKAVLKAALFARHYLMRPAASAQADVDKSHSKPTVAALEELRSKGISDEFLVTKVVD